MNHKNNILNVLNKLKESYRLDGEHFKLRAYNKVIANIENFTEPITSIEQVENIDGVGKSIKSNLRDIISNGNIEYNENVLKSNLTQIYGVGPKKADDLIKLNITSINDLRCKLKTNPNILTYAQTIGLMCYEDLLERIPRKEMMQHKKKLSLGKKGEIVGSFRRGEETSGDIDVMLNMNVDEFNHFVDKLIKDKYINYILAKGDKKLLGICSLPNNKYRRLDLIRNTPDEYPYMKLYFTGPKEFNIVFRNHCLSLGLSLNEHQFSPKVDGLLTEEDIFRYVGLEYIVPEKRKNKISCL